MSPKPNFLIIVADDLGFSDVGCYGSEIKTPNIDRLAQHGLRFTDFHAASACSPTRSMILSGTDHHLAGIGAMNESIPDDKKGTPGYEGYLSDQVAALPELLQDAGYYTVMSGKWHLGLGEERWPARRGFEKSFALLPGAANHYAYEPQLSNGETRHKLLEALRSIYVEDDQPVPLEHLGKDFYSSDAFTDKLLGYLQQQPVDEDKRPFFAYLAYSAPHWPLQAPEEDMLPYRGMYDDGPEVLRQKRVAALKKMNLVPEHAVPHDVVAPYTEQEASRTWEELSKDAQKLSARGMEAYSGMVQRMDTQIGRVIDYLEETGELSNTCIMFLSDNGAEGILLEAIPVINENIMEHINKHYDNSLENIGRANSYVWYGPHWASASTAPSRLYKSFTSEGGIRVPMILSYPPLTPHAAKEGRTIDHSFSTVMDLSPTILELAGTTHPGTTYRGRKVVPVRGASMKAYLTGAAPKIHSEEKVVGWELFGRLAVRKGPWKALFIPQPFGPERWELFNLDEDPGETRDLSSDRPEKLAEMLNDWEKYVNEVGVLKDAQRYGTLGLEEIMAQ